MSFPKIVNRRAVPQQYRVTARAKDAQPTDYFQNEQFLIYVEQDPAEPELMIFASKSMLKVSNLEVTTHFSSYTDLQYRL